MNLNSDFNRKVEEISPVPQPPRIYMVYIYDKSKFENINQKDLRKMLNEISMGE